MTVDFHPGGDIQGKRREDSWCSPLRGGGCWVTVAPKGKSHSNYFSVRDGPREVTGEETSTLTTVSLWWQ